MKLFCKHLFRSIRKAPMQTLLILLTVILSTAVSVTAFRMIFLFDDISRQSVFEERALGDLILSMKGESDVRLLFCEDVQKELDAYSDAVIVGEYALTAFYQTENASQILAVSATDLEAADRYFDFVYTQYGSFHTQNINQSAILSEQIATQFGISVGDPITLRIMGEDMTYTVQAIAKSEGLLNERDVLVSTNSVLRILAKHSPLLAAMGSDFSPCSRVFVRFSSPESAMAAAEALSHAPAYADKQITVTHNQSRTDYLTFFQRAAMSVMATVFLLLCGFLIATCLRLLQNKRQAESAFFYSVGATKQQLFSLQLLENGAYAILGGGIGLCLASPLLNAAWGLFDMPQKTVSLTFWGALFGMCFSILLMLGCTCLTWRGQKRLTIAEWLMQREVAPPATFREQSNKAIWHSLYGSFTCLLGVLLCVLAIAFVPLRMQFVPAIVAILFTVALLYCITPMLVRVFASLGERLLSLLGTKLPFCLLASKNLGRQFALGHVGRLLSVLLALLILITACNGALQNSMDMMANLFTGDMIAANVPTEAEMKLQNDPAVKSTSRFDIIRAARLEHVDSVTVFLVSKDTDTFLHHAVLPKRLPTSQETVISSGVSILTGKQVGDRITLTVDGIAREFTVSEVVNVPANFILLERDAIPTARDFLGISLQETAKNDPLAKETIYRMLEAQGVVFVNSSIFRPTSYRMQQGFSTLLGYATAAAVLISAVGCANLLAGQHRARQQERALLRLCGMTRVGLWRLQFTELAMLFGPVLLLGILFGSLLCLLMHLGMKSFGFSLFFL